jgi:hypothetical protein
MAISYRRKLGVDLQVQSATKIRAQRRIQLPKLSYSTSVFFRAPLIKMCVVKLLTDLCVYIERIHLMADTVKK